MNDPTRKGTRLGTRRITFIFDGKTCHGIEGDTVASALLASGVQTFGRSVKLHRARGLLSAGPEEPNALLSCGTKPFNIPNVPATGLVLRDGLTVTSQNRWPSLTFDLGALLGLGGGVFSAGFYYKTFILPGWRSYEGMIRRLAGLGNAPLASDAGVPDSEHIDCDVLVAGGGPAGIAAALAAARCGARTILCERDPAPGGELDFEDATINGISGRDWVSASLEELGSLGARVLTETAIVGVSGEIAIAHREPGGLPHNATAYRIHAGTLTMATGAVEQPIVFIDNDRPGVMLLGAAEKYLARYGVRVAESVLVFGNHNRLYEAARRLQRGGMKIEAIVDTRTVVNNAERDALLKSGVRCLTGHTVVASLGRRRIRGARVASIDQPDGTQDINCESILVSGGWRPNTLGSQGMPTDEESEWQTQAGASAGLIELGDVLESGYNSGFAAARRSNPARSTEHSLTDVGNTFGVIKGDPVPKLGPYARSPASLADEKRQFVDLQNDVTVADLRQALQQGFTDIEHVKRFTTLGVGTEQGATSTLVGARILAELTGNDESKVKPSRRRLPVRPVTLATLGGRRQGLALRPERHTPLHAWHVANGAVLEDSGMWMRPRYYKDNGADPTSAAAVEAKRVRESGGIVDSSTLGKIELAGPDAAKFLDRLYLTKASTIAVGRSKYMVLLREDGMVLDDGIVLRLTEDRYLATVSSGHAEHVLSHFEFWRDRTMPHFRVALTDATEAWAVIAVAGPCSKSVLGEILGEDWLRELQKLSHMAHTAGTWQGADLRVLRASFTGELAFELHCRASIATPLWQALVAAGMRPYGLEALDVVRIEKGYLTSAELNGQTTPMDLGMAGMLKTGNPCIGSELLSRPALSSPEREQLVGLRALDSTQPLLAGAQLTLPSEASHSCGHVTSAALSPMLGEHIALALVQQRYSDIDTKLVMRHPLLSIETSVRVVAPDHFDPAGMRMKT